MGRQKKDKNIGRRIGFLVVQRFDKKEGSYECLCDCGTAVSLTETQVRRSSVKACSSCKDKLPSRGKDLSAQQYGVLSVKYPYVEDGVVKRLWVCECNICGVESLHKAGALKDGTDYACPVCGAGSKYRDRLRMSFGLTGQTFGDFTVKGRNAIKNNDSHDEWVCSCDRCGDTEIFTRKEFLCRSHPVCRCHQTARPAVWVYRLPNGTLSAPPLERAAG